MFEWQCFVLTCGNVQRLVRLHELNCAKVKEGKLGSMRAAAGWSLQCGLLYISLHPALILSSPSFHFLFRSLSFTLACRFSSLLFIPCSLSLSLHYWYRTHLWIFPVSSVLMTSPLSLLSSSSLNLFLVYLSASLFLPLRQACWWTEFVLPHYFTPVFHWMPSMLA